MISHETIRARRKERAPKEEVALHEANSDKVGLDWAWVSGATLAVTLLGGVFYAAGKTWRDHLVLALGIHPDNVPATFHEYIYAGLIIQLEAIASIWAWVMAFLLILAGVVFITRLGGGLLGDWVIAKAKPHARSIRKHLLPWVLRMEGPTKHADAYLRLTSALYAMFILFAAFIFFVDSARNKGEAHAREILFDMKKGNKAKFSHVHIARQSGELIASGVPVIGNATAIVILNEAGGIITARLQPLSPDTIVLAKPAP